MYIYCLPLCSLLGASQNYPRRAFQTSEDRRRRSSEEGIRHTRDTGGLKGNLWNASPTGIMGA